MGEQTPTALLTTVHHHRHRHHRYRVLEELSLTRCADQRIGNVDYRGISGGERKRTSIALELLVRGGVRFVGEGSVSVGCMEWMAVGRKEKNSHVYCFRGDTCTHQPQAHTQGANQLTSHQ